MGQPTCSSPLAEHPLLVYCIPLSPHSCLLPLPHSLVSPISLFQPIFSLYLKVCSDSSTLKNPSSIYCFFSLPSWTTYPWPHPVIPSTLDLSPSLPLTLPINHLPDMNSPHGFHMFISYLWSHHVCLSLSLLPTVLPHKHRCSPRICPLDALLWPSPLKEAKKKPNYHLPMEATWISLSDPIPPVSAT